jgi:prepilin-type N-terminal cleavage/methylation domain-containing protein
VEDEVDTHRDSSQFVSAHRAGECRTRTNQRGFTVLELLIVVAILGILALIAIPYFDGRVEKAKLARCMNNLRSVQSTIFVHSDGWELPAPSTFWNLAWSGKKPGPYHYMVDSQDLNKGHGNDLDQFDEENPGKSKRERRDIRFVIICEHDHGELGWYVYIEDEGPPLVATYNNHPGYHRFIGRMDKGGAGGTTDGDTTGDTGGTGDTKPGGGKGGGPKPK